MLCPRTLSLALTLATLATLRQLILHPAGGGPALPLPADLCVATEEGVPLAAPCPRDVAGRRADPRHRAWLGEAACWWTLDRQGAEAVPGVGAGTVAVLLRWRDDGGLPDPAALDALPGIGAATARIIAREVTTACPWVDGAWRPPFSGSSTDARDGSSRATPPRAATAGSPATDRSPP